MPWGSWGGGDPSHCAPWAAFPWEQPFHTPWEQSTREHSYHHGHVLLRGRALFPREAETGSIPLLRPLFPGQHVPAPFHRALYQCGVKKQAVPGRPHCAIRENKEGEGNCTYGEGRDTAPAAWFPAACQLSALFFLIAALICLFWTGGGSPHGW